MNRILFQSMNTQCVLLTCANFPHCRCDFSPGVEICLRTSALHFINIGTYLPECHLLKKHRLNKLVQVVNSACDLSEIVNLHFEKLLCDDRSGVKVGSPDLDSSLPTGFRCCRWTRLR